MLFHYYIVEKKKNGLLAGDPRRCRVCVFSHVRWLFLGDPAFPPLVCAHGGTGASASSRAEGGMAVGEWPRNAGASCPRRVLPGALSHP